MFVVKYVFVRTHKTVEVPLLILYSTAHTDRQFGIVGRPKMRESIL